MKKKENCICCGQYRFNKVHGKYCKSCYKHKKINYDGEYRRTYNKAISKNLILKKIGLNLMQSRIIQVLNENKYKSIRQLSKQLKTNTNNISRAMIGLFRFGFVEYKFKNRIKIYRLRKR